MDTLFIVLGITVLILAIVLAVAFFCGFYENFYVKKSDSYVSMTRKQFMAFRAINPDKFFRSEQTDWIVYRQSRNREVDRPIHIPFFQCFLVHLGLDRESVNKREMADEKRRAENLQVLINDIQNDIDKFKAGN
jgi:hypothetical protein